MSDVNEDQGVFYRPEDYVHFWRRDLIDCIDVLVVSMLCLLLGILLFFVLGENPPRLRRVFALGCVGVGLWYFVILKRSRVRTVGYILAEARIVSLTGERPTIATLSLRLSFAILGPTNFIVDLLWLGGDPQALRDKFAHTYVVRKNAVPVGRGRLRYAQYCFLGMAFVFPEVTQAP